MNKKQVHDLRSKGEAHLYVGVAKADGFISTKEHARAPYYAQKSQDIFNVLRINKNVREHIKEYVRSLLSDPRFRAWTAEQHLDEAVSLLKQAKDAGDWGAALTIHKNEKGLLEVAFLDGYILKESRFLKEIESRLKILEE
jgi:hypothetical protein